MRLDARKASPAQFINTKIVEKLDKQGFIDGLHKKQRVRFWRYGLARPGHELRGGIEQISDASDWRR